MSDVILTSLFREQLIWNQDTSRAIIQETFQYQDTC